MCSATIHTVKVPANCTMIALGASVIRRVIVIDSVATRIAGDQAAGQRQQRWSARTRSIENAPSPTAPTATR